MIAVLPAYEEAPRIESVIRGILPYIPIVLVIDDGSKDETSVKAQAAGALVLRHRVNRGQGAALKTGTLAALSMGADIIVHMDSDGQHDPSNLPNLLAPILNGQADIVFGSRFLGIASEGMPKTRRLLLHLARKFINGYLLGIPRDITDSQSGLRAFRAVAAKDIDFRQDRMAHCSEILRLVTRSPWRWKEVPTKIRYTKETLAKSQTSADRVLEILWQLFMGAFR